MKILITGANGYVGRRLIPPLLQQGHELTCCVRNRSRFETTHRHERVHTIEIDFLDRSTFTPFPRGIDVAFYLIHSMAAAVGRFEEQEAESARHFLELVERTSCRQIIYLSGIANEKDLSHHLSSRLNVERILRSHRIPVTVLRAGIVVGSGSASFEIIRDLVEKLPVMVTPRWLTTLCQPIAVRDVVAVLVGVMLREETYQTDTDIGGPDVLTYKQMLLQFAEVRKLRRLILILPVMTPRLSSYWLYFVTQTSYALAVNLVDSMKVAIVARPNCLMKDLGIEPLSYRSAVRLALDHTGQQPALSSWKDSFISSGAARDMMQEIRAPEFGCFKDRRFRVITESVERVWERIWTIGGDRGWYYADWLWTIRGVLDKVAGGVGLNRGRTSATDIHAGDALDFWRVMVADNEGKRLLLFAEMKLPGEAWLEFRITRNNGEDRLVQTATFRPRGLLGRLYWYSALPFHYFIFNGMVARLVATR
jgi:uncharacterized protein YbjT (DUF2867 family)